MAFGTSPMIGGGFLWGVKKIIDNLIHAYREKYYVRFRA
jgi:hypothetical protein